MTQTQTPPAVVAPLPAAAPARSRRRGAVRQRLEIALFTGPALIVFLGFVILPVVLAAFYSLYNWNGLGPLERFIGIDNYVRALNDPVFIRAIGNNFTIVVLSLLVQGPLAIGVALLLNRKLRGRVVFRALIFVPYVLAEVIAGLSWKLLLSPRGGINAFLENVGLGDLAQPWLANPDIALGVMFVILTWEVPGLRDPADARRPAGRAAGAAGGGRDRRRELVADAVEHHAPAAGSDDPDLCVPVDHRLAAAFRHGSG